MIFADKLIELRKKHGMTQEELAAQMNVSRQSISKWEGAQSVPDLDKVLKLSTLFGVTTDYLLKDELELPEFTAAADEAPGLRRVTMEEAVSYLSLKDQSAGPVALGVMMCILSPVCLLMLGALGSEGFLPENLAGGLGVAVLLGLVAGAVGIFLYWGSKTENWKFLDNESFETAYGVEGMVRERQSKLRSAHVLRMVLGVMLCILCPVPLLAASAFSEQSLVIVSCVCVLLAMVAGGVGCMVHGTIVWEATQKLLQEGDFTPGKKRYAKITEAVGTIYWLLVSAGFLAYSFSTGRWGHSWIIWPVAGVLYGIVAVVCSLAAERRP